VDLSSLPNLSLSKTVWRQHKILTYLFLYYFIKISPSIVKKNENRSIVLEYIKTKAMP